MLVFVDGTQQITMQQSEVRGPLRCRHVAQALRPTCGSSAYQQRCWCQVCLRRRHAPVVDAPHGHDSTRGSRCKKAQLQLQHALGLDFAPSMLHALRIAVESSHFRMALALPMSGMFSSVGTESGGGAGGGAGRLLTRLR